MFSTFGLLTRFQKSCCITKCLQNCSLEFTKCFLCSLCLEQTPSYSAPQSLLFVNNWLKIEIIISSKFASAVTVTGNYFIQKACHVLDVRVVEEQHKEWGVVKNHLLLFFSICCSVHLSPSNQTIGRDYRREVLKMTTLEITSWN